MNRQKLSAPKTALRLAKRHGFRILPVSRTSKKPLISGWQEAATDDPKIVKKWFDRWPDCNYGIATGSEVSALDDDGKEGKSSLKKLEKAHGKLPPTMTVRTGRGHHYYFNSAGHSIGNSTGRLGPGLDVRGAGGFVVGPGSLHANGKRYAFEEGSGLDEVDIAKLPRALLKLLKAKPDSTSTEISADELTPKQKQRCIRYGDAVRNRELDRLGKSVEHQRNDNLNFAAYRLGQVSRWVDLDREPTVKELESIARHIGLDAAEIRPTIDSGWNAGRASKWVPPFLRKGAAPAHATPSPEQKLTAGLALLGETDADNAKRLLARCSRKLLYAPGAGWLVFDGRRWAPDLLDQRHKLAWETSRLIGEERGFITESGAAAGRAKFAKDSMSKAAVDRMLESAKHLLAVADERLDACPWLLNVANGSIDLRTGFRYNHDARDLITHIIPVRYSSKAKCPRFKGLLRFVTNGDEELSDFIQRAAGYSITGDTSEQVFYFLYGEGGTGKSTLVNAIRELLGTYGLHTPTDTLMAKTYENTISNDLARLKGARLVTAVEANFNRQLDEAKIKAMTGGEPITARFMRQEYFSFQPEFKLWIIANDFPRVRGTAESFWRRVVVIPFTRVVPEEKRDKHFSTLLREEFPGILAWLVAGCRQWQKSGLQIPDAVKNATGLWRKDADHVLKFTGEESFADPTSRVAASTMYDRYTKWCRKNGETPLGMALLKSKLMTLNFTHKRSKRGSEWVGVKLRAE